MHCLSHHLAPSKTKHLLVFIRICRIKIHMLGYPKIWRYPQRLDDHIPPGLNGRLRFNGGLHRAWLARRGPALARKMGRPTESEVTPCLQIFCLFWKVWDFRVCSVLGFVCVWLLLRVFAVQLPISQWLDHWFCKLVVFLLFLLFLLTFEA